MTGYTQQVRKKAKIKPKWTTDCAAFHSGAFSAPVSPSVLNISNQHKYPPDNPKFRCLWHLYISTQRLYKIKRLKNQSWAELICFVNLSKLKINFDQSSVFSSLKKNMNPDVLSYYSTLILLNTHLKHFFYCVYPGLMFRLGIPNQDPRLNGLWN